MKTLNPRYIEIIKTLLVIMLLIGGCCLYVYRGLDYAAHMHPMMDEGTYLLKGYYYLTGKYTPYQDYGPITNKPPLSFYILGLSQLIEPGLRSGRYFAIMLGLITLAGLWLTTRRLFNSLWASFLVFFISVSPAIIQFSTKAMTQVVTSCLLIWSLFFILGVNRKKWQLVAGAVLLAMLALTRQNLLPLYPLGVGYLIWQHGKKSILPIGLSLLVVLVNFGIFWPGLFISSVKTFLPKNVYLEVFDILKVNYLFPDGESVIEGAIDTNLWQKIVMLYQGIRNYLPSFLAAFLGIFVITPVRIAKTRDGKAILFLYVAYIINFILHYMAIFKTEELFNNFPSYLAFFWPLGILLIPVFFMLPKPKKPLCLRSITSVIALLVFFTGLGFGLFETISSPVLAIQVPRFKDGSFFPGTMSVSSILENKYDLVMRSQRMLSSALAGLMVGLAIILLVFVIWQLVRKKTSQPHFIYTLLSVVLSGAILFAPVDMFSGSTTIITCQAGDILSAHERAGSELREKIPAGSLVYSELTTPIPLLYLPEIRVFPQQLNKFFYFREGGTNDLLARTGYWNASLAKQWMEEADYLLVGGREPYNQYGRYLIQNINKFEEVIITDPIVPCIKQTKLSLFKAK